MTAVTAEKVCPCRGCTTAYAQGLAAGRAEAQASNADSCRDCDCQGDCGTFVAEVKR